MKRTRASGTLGLNKVTRLDATFQGQVELSIKVLVL